MYEKDGGGKVREGMNMIERTSAYGITFKGTNKEDGAYIINIVSLAKEDIHVKKNDAGKVYLSSSSFSH